MVTKRGDIEIGSGGSMNCEGTALAKLSSRVEPKGESGERVGQYMKDITSHAMFDALRRKAWYLAGACNFA